MESLNKTIDEFELREFDFEKIREYSYNFDISIFRKDFISLISDKIKERPEEK